MRDPILPLVNTNMLVPFVFVEANDEAPVSRHSFFGTYRLVHKDGKERCPYAEGESVSFVSVEANEKDGGHSHVVCTSTAEQVDKW